jgi:hypothetical protein
MKKDMMICFRTTEMLHKSLEARARKEKRSVSSTIEIILTEHFRTSSDLGKDGERRRYARKPVRLPALVKPANADAARYGGVVLDISLGGLHLSFPTECARDVCGSEGQSRFEIAFVVPEASKPIRMACLPRRVEPSNGDVHVGASFVDADFVHYQQLQQYLM